MIDYMVREGKRVAPFCPECGCRLGQFEDMWYHFVPENTVYVERDARGHKCSLVNNFWELPQENKT